SRISCFLYHTSYLNHPSLHSFPTRRSSDLFNILEDQTICLLIITYFKPVQPFPFDKCMKRFDTCIIPWESLFRVAALHFCSSFPISLGYVLTSSITEDN